MGDEWQGRTRRTRPVPDVPDDLDLADRHSRARQELRAVPLHVWLMAAIVLAMLVTVCAVWGLVLLREGRLGRATATPTVLTPSAEASPSPTATELLEPTPTLSPDIVVGSRVRVAGTEGEGLSLRAGPGTAYTRMDIALDGEIFIVADGPTRAGGVTWWKLRDPADSQRSYWAVGNYLELVVEP
jgi:hypothetical protein